MWPLHAFGLVAVGGVGTWGAAAADSGAGAPSNELRGRRWGAPANSFVADTLQRTMGDSVAAI